MQILMTIAYDGTDYCGWQRQNNGVTVQQRLEEALSALYARPITVTGASRTDSGVHALGQKACFCIERAFLPVEKLPAAIKSKLPPDIVVTDAREVPDTFHPRFSAAHKTYAYQIQNSPYHDPLRRLTAWHVYNRLDFSAMREAAERFVGTHDFAAFCASGNSSKTTVRTVFEAALSRGERGLITFTVRGDAFLYNMVRIMAGTVIYAGIGKIKPDDVPGIIASKDRKLAGKTAPPHGLTLVDVAY